MPSSRELIILISVLLVSLIVALIGPYPPSDNGNKDIQSNAENNNNISVFKNKTEQFNKQSNQMQNIISSEDQIVENISVPENNQEKTYQTNTDNSYTIIPLSLEAVLNEIENLSSDLKLEFDKIRKQKENCPTCNQQEKSSFSTCATILTAPGGGGCSCESLGCLPEEGPQCTDPCCCVCCAPCCGG